MITTSALSDGYTRVHLMTLRQEIQRWLARCGYDVRRIPAVPPLGADAFRDMRRLALEQVSPVILDVGANAGQSALAFRRTFPSPTIHCFEPNPDIFAELRVRTQHLPGVFLNNIGVGAREETREFVANTRSPMSSFLEPDIDAWGDVLRRQPLRLTTLDRYCDRLGPTPVDILKSDTQGFELEVLRGATGLLAHRRVRMVYLEVIFSQMYVGLPRFDDIFGFLADRGYRLVSLYDCHYQRDRLGWADALFICDDAVAGST